MRWCRSSPSQGEGKSLYSAGAWILSWFVFAVAFILPIVLFGILLRGGFRPFSRFLTVSLILWGIAFLLLIFCSHCWFPFKNHFRRDLISVAMGGLIAVELTSLLRSLESNRCYPQQNYLWFLFAVLSLLGCLILFYVYMEVLREPFHPVVILRNVGLAGHFFWIAFFFVAVCSYWGEDFVRNILE